MMSKIQEVSNKIRDVLHDSTIAKTKIFLKKDRGFWDQLWTCLDTIGDTEIAVQSFNKLTAKDFQESSYLHTYGLLQALYLQQDAVSNLKEAILGKSINWEVEYPSVFLVRTTRNESTGHPTKIGKKLPNKYCVIDRSSLSKDGFSYIIWSNSSTNRRTVRFSHLLKSQEEALHRELSEILKQIQKAELTHKKKFAGYSLAQLIPDGELYSSKLLGNISFRPIDHLAWMVYEDFKEKYIEIKKGIESRYGPINNTLTIPGTELLINELDRIFLRIDEFKNSQEDYSIDIGIYAEALIDRIQELKNHLIEVDEQFTIK